ncbi:hypothetical protein FVEG_17142 [Fusarium verticillioides 7600]|uniref:Transcription factor domain-containing protein n=1 Tax=Gibberella moniliformis (strain M3125 / FGSC 7600) TaxID=334819 RepID=W7NAS7_GIBM7|nr:hypothetical protein FVEG_17142 [Fusarium verticillioides 7600]EWG53577.1 hypothetical protein FVEG_17142 [Fusarium verticillioides 7600]
MRQSETYEQLIYGPTSRSVLLQTLQDLLNHLVQRRTNSSRHEVPSLGTFTKRTTFFGTPSRVDALLLPYQQQMEDILMESTAVTFLQAFENYSSHALPFINIDKTRVLLDSLRNAGPSDISPRDKALLLTILAISALGTSETDTTEALLIYAKREVALFDDAATLLIVHFCLLMSDYQLNMGRSNAAYLQFCSACAKAMSMGLHIQGGSDAVEDGHQV